MITLQRFAGICIFLLMLLMGSGIVLYYSSGKSIVDRQNRTINEQNQIIEEMQRDKAIQEEHLRATKAIAEALQDLDRRLTKVEGKKK